MQRITMAISGMSCGGCVGAVRRAIGGVPGTRVDAVTVGSATVSYDPSRTTPAAIARAVEEAGYRPAAAPAAGAGPARGSGGCCGGRSGSGGG